jgi:hypothetical protein
VARWIYQDFGVARSIAYESYIVFVRFFVRLAGIAQCDEGKTEGKKLRSKRQS